MPEDALLVERDPARRGEIGGDGRQRLDPGIMGNGERQALLKARHGAGEGVAEALNHLKERKVRVGSLSPIRQALPARLFWSTCSK